MLNAHGPRYSPASPAYRHDGPSCPPGGGGRGAAPPVMHHGTAFNVGDVGIHGYAYGARQASPSLSPVQAHQPQVVGRAPAAWATGTQSGRAREDLSSAQQLLMGHALQKPRREGVRAGKAQSPPRINAEPLQVPAPKRAAAGAVHVGVPHPVATPPRRLPPASSGPQDRALSPTRPTARPSPSPHVTGAPSPPSSPSPYQHYASPAQLASPQPRDPVWHGGGFVQKHDPATLALRSELEDLLHPRPRGGASGEPAVPEKSESFKKLEKQVAALEEDVEGESGRVENQLAVDKYEDRRARAMEIAQRLNLDRNKTKTVIPQCSDAGGPGSRAGSIVSGLSKTASNVTRTASRRSALSNTPSAVAPSSAGGAGDGAGDGSGAGRSAALSNASTLPTPSAASAPDGDAEGGAEGEFAPEALDAEALDAETLDAEALDAEALDAEALDALKDLFNKADGGGSGKLSQEEMEECFKAIGLDEDAAKLASERAVRNFDKDGDGHVAWEEWLDMHKDASEKDGVDGDTVPAG